MRKIMRIISDADGLVLTSTINIYAQQLHQLGQILFNYKGEMNEDYNILLKQSHIAANNIKEKTIELMNKIESVE
jgi:hypothetical protein